MGRRLLYSALIGGLVGYLVTIGICFTPTDWGLPALIVCVLCPPALASFTVDSSLTTVALVLAPLNALLYGIAGLFVGLATGGNGHAPAEDRSRSGFFRGKK